MSNLSKNDLRNWINCADMLWTKDNILRLYKVWEQDPFSLWMEFSKGGANFKEYQSFIKALKKEKEAI